MLDGDLEQVARAGKQSPNDYSDAQKRQFHAMLLHLALSRGNKPGAAAHRFKAKFGHWPLDHYISPVPPNAEVTAWDRHCRIKFAKSMQKASANG